MSLHSGMRLGPYEVLALLGSGGMAEVYRARDLRLEREVAIKILPKELSSDLEALARFTREARTASALSHPHLVTIYDIGVSEIDKYRLHYIAMELITGQTLRHHLMHAARDVLLRHVACVADGLAKAHDAGVVHRDLKPENIMVTDDDFAKVVDFGLARAAGLLTKPGAQYLTAEGFCVGTAAYMAPEQVRGLRDVDGRADIFALGCILYEIAARENAFDGETPIETMHRILTHEPPPLADSAIDAIVRRCIAKDRAQRYASMREVAADLRNAMGTPIRTGNVPKPPAISSIAVLPFHNRSGNEEMNFLSDGIPEDIVRDLGRVAGLRVIASSSAWRFRNTNDPQHAARELNVEAVLVGGLRTIAGTLMLDAELVKGADGTALWGKKYTRQLTDIIALEQEIARDLCAEVRLKVAPAAKRAAEPEAHAAYLRGYAEVRHETAQSMKNGVEHFHRAIELDPEYALPHAALALVYGRAVRVGLAPTRESVRQQIALANHALALDDALPEGHWNLALAGLLVEDMPEYERRAARVLELNPNFAPAHVERANQLVLMERYEEAEIAHQHARALDPLSVRVMSTYAAHLSWMRKFDRALEVWGAALEQFPESVNTRAYCALVTAFSLDKREGLAMIQAVPTDANPMFELFKGIILAWNGRMDEARAIANWAGEQAKSRYVVPFYRAALHSALGDNDAAFALIERGIRDGDYWFGWLRYDACFDPLRSDPRFAQMIEKRNDATGLMRRLP